MRPVPLSLLAAVCMLAPTSSGAGEPSVRDLVALAPVIRTSDPAVKSLEVAGYDRADGQVVRTFRAVYRAPDRFSFVVRDGRDGTPLMVAVDKKMLVYDPVQPQILVYPHVSNYRLLGVVNGKYEDNWGARLPGREPDSIVLDLRSVFTAPPKAGASPAPESVAHEGGRRYTLIRQGEPSWDRLHFDLDRPNPVVSFETAASPGGPPTRCIDRIVVNGPIADSEFAFPSLDGLDASLPVREARDGVFGSTEAIKVLLQTIYVRQTIHEPKGKRGIIAPLMAGVRWSRVEANDARYAGLVRGLIPPDPVGRTFPPEGLDDPDAVKRTGFDAIRDHLPHLPYKVKLRVETK